MEFQLSKNQESHIILLPSKNIMIQPSYLKIRGYVFITKEFEEWFNIRKPVFPFYGVPIFHNLNKQETHSKKMLLLSNKKGKISYNNETLDYA